MPVGCDKVTWDKIFNRADSRIYGSQGKDKHASAWARWQRITYQLAIDIYEGKVRKEMTYIKGDNLAS